MTHAPLSGYMIQPAITLDHYQHLVGQHLGTSDWIRIDQPIIDAFAALTGDNQYIHIDPEQARLGPFGGTVAHGFLTLSLIGGLGPRLLPPLADARAALNYGFDRVRIISPVPEGSRIRGAFALDGIDVRDAGHVTTRVGVTVEIEDQTKPALVAQWLVVYHF